MKKILIISLLLPILAMKCYPKEGHDCHHKVSFRNNSDFTVMLAELYKGSGGCRFIFREFKPGTELVEREDNCWEDQMPVERYILSPENLRKMDADYYSCDSIGIKNKILKHYVLNLDSMIKKNWVVNYPE